MEYPQISVSDWFDFCNNQQLMKLKQQVLTLGSDLTMLPNWNVNAINEETESVILAGSAFVSIQKAIHDMNTDM